MKKTESVIEHYSKTNVQVHDILMGRFMIESKMGEDVDDNKLMKLASSIGFIQQTQASIQKNIYSENDIKEINRRLDRIPPEILQQALTPLILDPLEAK